MPVALTLAIGTVGGLLFYWLSVPAAFLTGSALAVALAVAVGVRTAVPKPVRIAGLSLIGVIMAGGITPDAVQTIMTLPVALLGMAIATAGAGTASYIVLRRLAGWDPLTALCSSIPGALSVVLAVADESGARMERVMVAQALRLMILVAVVPLLFGGGASSPMPVEAGTASSIAISLALASTGVIATLLTGMSVLAMLTPLFVAGLLAATGVLQVAVPTPLAALAFVVLGASVADRFNDVTNTNWLSVFGASLGSFVAAAAVAASVAALFAHVLNEPYGAVFLAFAPGGVDAMIALSFLLGFDVAFVSLLHAARIAMLSLVSPPLVALQLRSIAQNTGRSTPQEHTP